MIDFHCVSQYFGDSQNLIQDVAQQKGVYSKYFDSLSVDITSALKCWECESADNWDKCKMVKSITCVDPQTRCGKFYLKQGAVETFKRDCYTENECKTKPQCQAGASKCDLSCCKTDACNAAILGKSIPMGFFIFALIFVLYLIVFQ